MNEKAKTAFSGVGYGREGEIKGEEGKGKELEGELKLIPFSISLLTASLSLARSSFLSRLFSNSTVLSKSL